MGDTKKFAPSAKQNDYLDVWCEPGLKQYVSTMAEKAGVSRTIVYEWYRNPDFVEWFNAEYARRRSFRKPGIINAMEQKALEGDVNAAKVAMQTGDDLTYRPGGGVSVEAGGPVTIRIARSDEGEDSPKDG